MDNKICPNCGSALVGVPASGVNVSTWIELYVGFALLPILIGLIIINSALKRMHSTPTHLDCPNCPWNNLSYKWDPVSEGEGVDRFLPPESGYNKIWLYIGYAIISAVILLCWVVLIWSHIEEGYW